MNSANEAMVSVAARPLATSSQWMPIEELAAQVVVIQQAMKAVMRDNEHYGTIPGTPKPSLWKPGAEKLCFLFRLAPDYEISALEMSDKIVTYQVKCVLRNINTGAVWGSGMGLCSSRESKYGLRDSKRQCPHCGKAAIIKGKQEYGGGWVCFKKQDGCGAKFTDGDASIERQAAGKIPVDNVWEQANTILKMACKRAHVAAVLASTAASDIFTQDLEDLADAGVVVGNAASATRSDGRTAARPEARKLGPKTVAVIEKIRMAKSSEQLLAIAKDAEALPEQEKRVARAAWAKRFSEVGGEVEAEPPHDPETGEVIEASTEATDDYSYGPPPMPEEAQQPATKRVLNKITGGKSAPGVDG